MKNNGMKKNIAKRLRHNEKEAEKFRDELGDKITGEDRRELMELQYQVGRLELENMELEQHRIVHESILKGKDLEIQKLKLQLAVRDKVINRQQNVLIESNLDHKVSMHTDDFLLKYGYPLNCSNGLWWSHNSQIYPHFGRTRLADIVS